MSFKRVFLESLLMGGDKRYKPYESLTKYFDDWIETFPGNSREEKKINAEKDNPQKYNKILNLILSYQFPKIKKYGPYQSKHQYYIRFGEIPSSGKSGVHYGGKYSGYDEQGLSVYPAKWNKQYDKWEVEDGDDQYIIGYDFNRNSDKLILLLTGEELPDNGEDNEPLLAPGSTKVIKQLNKNDFFMPNVDDPDVDYED